MHPFKSDFLIIALLLLFTFGCQEDAVQISHVDEFDEYVLEEMTDQDIPALSLLIFREQQVLHERLFGRADVESGTSLTAEHVFLLASISKTVTATALLQLHDLGHFQLDDPINDYLPFQVNVPGQNTNITFRMLLTHTSAIADGSALDDQYYFGQDSPVALVDFMKNYLTPGGSFYQTIENFHDFAPGTQHEYSNVGSALIGVLVEVISGKDFNAYCKTNIFEPLGMNDTFWRLDEIDQPIVTPYEMEGSDYLPVPHYTFTDYPNGGLRSTASDMFKFLSTLAMDGTSNGFQLLKPTTARAMRTPQIPSIDGEVGLHFFIMNKNHQLWGHDGGERGVATIMAFNPEDRTGAIVLANFGDGDLDKMLQEAYLLGKQL